MTAIVSSPSAILIPTLDANANIDTIPGIILILTSGYFSLNSLWIYIQVLYSDGSPTVRYTTFLPSRTDSAIVLVFFSYVSSCIFLSFTIVITSLTFYVFFELYTIVVIF